MDLCIFVDCKKRTKLVKENIYVPTGKKMLVTNADPINRCVYTFNNRRPMKSMPEYWAFRFTICMMRSFRIR
ncbi:hypothetical protein [Ligilactobacillus ruminis]|uniref:hypothetical protein n=1 Tax=Ligilactobacillus ruminis TaxID=1623 RepID=UPI003D08D938